MNTKTFICIALAFVSCQANSQPMTHEQEVVLQVCDQGRRAMDESCSGQCKKMSLNPFSQECLGSCEFAKTYFFARCDTMKWSEVLKVLGGVCPYLNEANYGGSFLRYCQTQDSKVKFCMDLKEALDATCGESCYEVTGEYFERCENMTWGQIKKSLLKTSCDYLEVNGYRGPFYKNCKFSF